MKIRIIQTVDVDADAWANEFGLDKKEVRDDVKAYFSNWLQSHVDHLDLAPGITWEDWDKSINLRNYIGE